MGPPKCHTHSLHNTGVQIAVGPCDIDGVVSLPVESTESGKSLGIFKGRDNSCGQQ